MQHVEYKQSGRSDAAGYLSGTEAEGSRRQERKLTLRMPANAEARQPMFKVDPFSWTSDPLG